VGVFATAQEAAVCYARMSNGLDDDDDPKDHEASGAEGKEDGEEGNEEEDEEADGEEEGGDHEAGEEEEGEEAPGPSRTERTRIKSTLAPGCAVRVLRDGMEGQTGRISTAKCGFYHVVFDDGGLVFFRGKELVPVAEEEEGEQEGNEDRVRVKAARRWSTDELARLEHLVAAKGKQWAAIAKAMNTGRSAKAVSQRWEVLCNKRNADGTLVR